MKVDKNKKKNILRIKRNWYESKCQCKLKLTFFKTDVDKMVSQDIMND